MQLFHTERVFDEQLHYHCYRNPTHRLHRYEEALDQFQMNQQHKLQHYERR